MLLPKRVKYRREHRGKMRGMAKGGTEVHFGEFGLQAQEASWITNRQIEAARIAMTRYMKRGGKFGSKSSQANLTQLSRLKYGWVPVKVLLKDG